MIDSKKIPQNVMRNLRDIGMSTDEIELSTPTELFDAWLEWEGIIGYTTHIIHAFESFKKAELPKEK